MAEAALGAAQWVVRKALAPVEDGMLEAWAASRTFGLNIQALGAELLQVQATLETAATKELASRPATEKLLQNLSDTVHDAEDLLDELDYFRIHDELHGTYHAADQHGDGVFRDLARDACHTVKALGKLFSCFPWQHAELQQRSLDDSFSASDANQGVSGCITNLGKLFLSTCSPHPHVLGDEDSGNAQDTPMLEFNRVDFSQRVKETVEQLKLRSEKVDKILTHCGPRAALDIAQHRPTTTPQSAEPKLYGRDCVMKSIIHDIIEGQYRDKGLTVLPVIGLGGMGKTTLIQHIYKNQQVQNHFPVRIWICVSFNFNRDKVLEEIKRYTPQVEDEKECVRPEELIVQRLKSKRFLLILDDIWHISNRDDWTKLLLTLGQSAEKGSMILVTTRQKEIAQMVKTTDRPKELNGLEPEEFRKIFLTIVFDNEQCPADKSFLLDIGYKIMEKLKGSPLAAKTVGRLLRTMDPSLPHWRRVLESKEWAKQTDDNDIMPALKLSYDFLPFYLQQCFSYSALFPEDYHCSSHELISLWIGLDILIPTDQNPTFEEIGLSNIKELVVRGFFREEKTNDDPCYVMHDLLHDLALMVASHDCLSFRLSEVGSVEIKPSTRHLSISIENLGESNEVSGQKLKRELEKLKTRLKVKHLQTLMLFGAMDEGFGKIFGDFIGEANALRVLYLRDMECHAESMQQNFSALVHLRCLTLGRCEFDMHLPNISKFYHLRVLDLEKWFGSHDLPEDMSNLAKLCHFHVIYYKGEVHSDICNVGKLKLLERLKVFRVNKKSKGFGPKQLEPLTNLRELGIYNLEKVHTEEEVAPAKLIEKKHLRRLTLEWDIKRSNVEPDEEAVVLERLQPHGDLQVLCIIGYGGPSCPTWLGDKLDLRELRLEDMARLKEFIIGKSFRMLIKLELIGLGSFEKWVYPTKLESSLGGDVLPRDAHIFPALQVLIIIKCPKILEFPVSNHFLYPKLQELEIHDCPEFASVIYISWIESLRRVRVTRVKLLEKFEYSKSSDGVELKIKGKDDLHGLDQVLVFNKETILEKLTLKWCPPLELKHLLMLTSLKKLIVSHSDALVGPLGGKGDVELQLRVEYICINGLNGISGEELTRLLAHLPRLSKLEIWNGRNIKKLVVGVDVQQTTSEESEMGGGEITAAAEEEDDGVLLFPAHLCDSLRELVIINCRELVLVDPPTLVPGGGWLQALRTLQRLTIRYCEKFLSAFSVSRHIFPSSLKFLDLGNVRGMGTLEPLSNLSSVTELKVCWCGKDLKCQGLQSLLTTGGQLNELQVLGSPRFFADWDPNPKCALENAQGEEQQAQLVSSTLRELSTVDSAGLLSAPICTFLSSSLTKLALCGFESEGMERFSKEQEDALQSLSSLQELEFVGFDDLQQLPEGLRNLTSLKKLSISSCPAISSLPKDGLPKSLQGLDVILSGNKELEQQCRGWEPSQKS